MSNNFNDFDFEDDDDFDFDNDNDFDLGGDDDFARDEGDFSFEDDVDFEFDDNGNDFDFGDDEELSFDEEEPASGPSRTFLYIAGVMVLLFVVALIALVLISSNQGPTPVEQTATAIVILNSTTIAQGLETSTAGAIFQLTQDAQAAMTATANALPSDTPTLEPSPTPTVVVTATPDATEAAALAFQTDVALQTQAALDLTGTASVLALTPQGQPTIGINSVQMTATALAERLLLPTVDQGGGLASPTQDSGPTSVALPTQLPDSGFFDDLAAGNVSGSLGGIMLAFMGLLGLIFISRRVRAANR